MAYKERLNKLKLKKNYLGRKEWGALIVDETDYDWLIEQVEKMTEEIEILNGALDLKAQEFVIERNKAVRYEKALREIIAIDDESGSVGYLLDKAIRIAKQAVEVRNE